MPEITFRLRWPDETETVAYSPSTVIKTYFDVGQAYTVTEFAALARRAMAAASERVRETYGYPCSRAAATLAMIEQKSAKFAGTDAVTFLEFSA